MDWKSRGLWRLGLLKKTKLPQSNAQLLMIEKLVVTLLRIEVCLLFHRYFMTVRHTDFICLERYFLLINFFPYIVNTQSY